MRFPTLPLIPGLTAPPQTPSLPVAPAVMPPDSPQVALGTPAPPQPDNSFSAGLQRALPIILGVIARAKGGPLAGAGLLSGYSSAQEAQRRAEEAQQRYEQAQAISEQDRKAKQDEAARQRQIALESFVEHQAQILNDPKNGFQSDPQRWAATVSSADTQARKVFGAPAGYVSSHPLLQYSDQKAAGLARDEAQATLEKVHKAVGEENWAKMNETPEAFSVGGKPFADLLAAASYTVTQDGKPLTAPIQGGPYQRVAIETADGKAGFANYDPKTGKFYDLDTGAVLQGVKPAPTSSGSGLNTLYSATDPAAIAGAIIQGAAPPEVSGLGRVVAGAVQTQLANHGYNLAQAQLDWVAVKKHAQSVNGFPAIRLVSATQTALDSLDVIDRLSDQLGRLVPRSQVNMLTRASMTAAKNGAYGQAAKDVATQLDAQITDVASEIAQVYMGGNSPTDHALSLASKNLSSEWNQKTLKAATDLARTNLGIRKNSLMNATPMGVGADSPYLQPPPAAPPPKPEETVPEDIAQRMVGKPALHRIKVLDPVTKQVLEIWEMGTDGKVHRVQ